MLILNAIRRFFLRFEVLKLPKVTKAGSNSEKLTPEYR